MQYHRPYFARDVYLTLMSPLGRQAAAEGWLPTLVDRVEETGRHGWTAAEIMEMREAEESLQAKMERFIGQDPAFVGGGSHEVGAALQALRATMLEQRRALTREFRARHGLPDPEEDARAGKLG